MKLQTLHMTPAELAVNAKIEADIAAGVDPFGEEDENPQDTDLPEDETTPVNTTAEATDPPAAEPVVEPPVTAEVPAEPVVEPPVTATTAEATPPADFGVAPDLTDLKGLVLPVVPDVDVVAFQTARTELNTKIAEIDAKFEAGDLTPQERDAQRAPLADQLDELKQQHAIDVAEQRASARLAQATQEQVLGRLRAAGARDGLDYGTPGAEPTMHATQFDMVTRALYADPKNRTKSWVEMAALADAQVRAMNGVAPKPAVAATPAVAAPVAPKPAVAAKAPAAARAAPPAPPQTLRELPAAARSSEASETIAGKLAAANAHGKDALWNKMTRAQQLAILGED